MKIYLDFDGTVTIHKYPDIGIYNEGCFEVVRKLQDAGHEIILNTYRANCNDGTLEEAIEYLKNADQILPILKVEKLKVKPIPWDWKVFKQKQLIFIDDICPGSPLRKAERSEYMVVDWERIDKEFSEHGIY